MTPPTLLYLTTPTIPYTHSSIPKLNSPPDHCHLPNHAHLLINQPNNFPPSLPSDQPIPPSPPTHLLATPTFYLGPSDSPSGLGLIPT